MRSRSEHRCKMNFFALCCIMLVFAAFLSTSPTSLAWAQSADPANPADTNGAPMPDPSKSSTERVSIKADGFIQVLAGGDEVFAQDGVEVYFQDLQIRADELHYIAKSHRAFFAGNVQMAQDNSFVEGNSLEYDFKNKISRIDAAKATITDHDLAGDVYIKGDIETMDDLIFIQDGTATTCDLEKPHFHLKAGELEIYPDDKMVIRNVSYWEGRVPLFYWPYLVIPLGRTSAFELPQIGHSPSEGWFIKIAYNYYRDRESYGKLHLDYMQKKGYGTGVDHTYADGADSGKGNVFVYRLYNPKTQITTWEGDWQHAWQLNPEVEIELGTGYWLKPKQGVENEEWEMSPRVKLTGENKKTAYQVEAEHRRLHYDEFVSESEIEWNFNQILNDTWRFSTKGQGLRLGPFDTQGSYLMYEHSLNATTTHSQLQLKLEKDVHPAVRGSKYSSFTWETLERLPEIMWHTRGLTLFNGKLPVQVGAQAGYYRETYPKKTGLAGTKLKLDGGIQGKRFNLSPKVYAIYDANMEFDAYRGLSFYERDTDGETSLKTPLEDMSRMVLLSRPRLVLRPTEPLTVEVSYTDRWVLGDTPFLFDEVKNSETLSGRITWRTPKFGASLASGYDFWSSTYSDIIGQVHIRPNERYELNLGATYSIEDEDWKTARGTIHLMPRDDVFLKFASTYSFVYESWDHLNAHMQVTLPNNWRLEYAAGYSGVEEKWTESSAVLAMDLHCRELRLRYDHLDSAVWLEYSINAFPKTSITMGGAEQVDFKVDGLADLVSRVSH